jgi:hypothetical protein
VWFAFTHHGLKHHIMWEIYAFAGIVNPIFFLKKKLHYYYRFSDRPIDRHGVLPKRVRILWDWEDLKDGGSGWPAAQPIRQNPGSEGLIRFRHRINQAIPITDNKCALQQVN